VVERGAACIPQIHHNIMEVIDSYELSVIILKEPPAEIKYTNLLDNERRTICYARVFIS
jgi:hypothetical protein